MSHTIAAIHSQRNFIIAILLLFAISVAATIIWCASMSTMCGRPMPGGWTLSMPWMPMPGQTWFGAATSFLGMWSVMMIAMMLPSLMPMLLRYRNALGRVNAARIEWLTVFVGCGYFAVWIVLGAVVFVLGTMLVQIAADLPLLSRAMPSLAGVVVLMAGVLQFSGWKTRKLDCCRQMPHHDDTIPANSAVAWRHGLRLGVHCCNCCAGLTAILLVVGVMDLQAMALVMAAITAERVFRAGRDLARLSGGIIVVLGLSLIAQGTAII